MNNIINTFQVFKAPPSMKETLKDSKTNLKLSPILNSAKNKADTTIPTPKESKTRFVINTIIIASIGGTIAQIVPSISFFNSSSFIVLYVFSYHHELWLGNILTFYFLKRYP